MKDIGHATAAIALAVIASSACAMNAPVPARARCQVVEAGKLPAASGGADALCAAIDRAAVARGVRSDFTVAVKIGARAMLSADVTLADGTALAAVHMAEMDRPVTSATLERFATAIANHIAGATR